MAGPKQIDPLLRLTGMVLDARLSRLRKVAAARNASIAALAALAEKGAPAPYGLSPVAAAQAEMRYQAWADRRRAEINTRLARQTAEWMEARSSAATAFGRSEALSALRDNAAEEAARKRRR